MKADRQLQMRGSVEEVLEKVSRGLLQRRVLQHNLAQTRERRLRALPDVTSLDPVAVLQLQNLHVRKQRDEVRRVIHEAEEGLVQGKRLAENGELAHLRSERADMVGDIAVGGAVFQLFHGDSDALGILRAAKREIAERGAVDVVEKRRVEQVGEEIGIKVSGLCVGGETREDDICDAADGEHVGKEFANFFLFAQKRRAALDLRGIAGDGGAASLHGENIARRN